MTRDMVRKITISLDEELAASIAQRAEGSVSAWLADAARARLRHERLVEAVAAYETEAEAFTEAELAELRTEWPA
jgi:hypothetical protein